MSRRMVICCDECEQQADMMYPAAYSGSAGVLGGPVIVAGTIGGREISPQRQPPEGWFERYAGLRGILDFCSATCVMAWDQRQSKGGALA